MSEQKPNILEQSFDMLSSIPYLKHAFKIGWVVSTLLLAVSFLIGDWGSHEHLIKSGIFYVSGNFVFAYIFRSWDKREKFVTEQKNIAKKLKGFE